MTIQDFQKTVSRSNVGFLDIENGVLVKHDTHKVLQFTYSVPGRDGRPVKLTRVFKPEVTARIGLTTISAGADNAAVNSVTRLNRATRRAAEFLGVGQLVDPITVGMHDGRLGFFMTKADAMHPGAVWMRAGTSEPGWNRTKGTLLRELTCLAWLDWLTGQMDRHGRNYLVSIDSNGEAVVKGIDNDTSFAATRRGVQKFELTKNRLQDLLYCEGGGTTAEAFMARYKDHIRTIVDDPPRKPPRHELDLAGASKHLVDLVIKAYGVNSMSRPRLITQSMYGKLAALEGKDDKEYLAMAAQIMGRPGFTADQYTATANRLREMVDYVKKVPSDVTVVPDEEWTRLDRVNNLADLARTGLTDARAGYLERDFH